MATLSINVPEPLKAFVDAQVCAGTFSNASEYVQSLIRSDIQARRRATMEDEVQEGLDALARGEGAEMTAEDWSKLHEEPLSHHKKSRSA